MKSLRITALIVLVFSIYSCSFITPSQPVDYVDPFIGTGGHGHTFPGPTVPFGMVQLSPDTRLEGWDGCSGYHYSDSVVYGFSHTHLSGTGVADYCDILFMPQSGQYHLNNGYEAGVENGYASRFHKSNEKATPGYYYTYLDDYAIRVELTASPRVGFHKYTYENEGDAHLIIDLKHRDEVLESSIEQISATEVVGMRRSKSWAQNQVVYFYARFNRPLTKFDIAVNDTLHRGLKKMMGYNLKAVLGFDRTVGDEVLAKVGISAVSIEGARKNLEQEIPHWNFDQTREEASDAWNKALSKIEIKAPREQKTIFYTAMYHSMIAPNLFTDVDGKYRGTDFNIHKANDYSHYTIFSLWDTYRATHPLYTIIDQQRTRDFIQTFLNMYQQGGQLPVWELAANYTGCMIGYHAVPVIADAWAKGIRGYDSTLALEAMKSSAMQDHLGLESYKKYGYIPGHKEHESVSKTLEYAYDDWCIAQMAGDLGAQDDYEQFMKRAQSYKNIFDPETGFMRAKMHGMWKTPFDPAEVDFNYTEANSWQYSFYVPQDVSGLMNLHGGKATFAEKLDQLFDAANQTTGRHQVDITGLIGQYAHGNEPSHHMAYLYNYAEQPWKTQKRVQEIMDEMYSIHPDGLIGNEDCGQMSSWYVLSAMGFYPVTPGDTIYAIGSPALKEAVIQLENGNSFKISADIGRDKPYIRELHLNGKPYKKSYISHQTIMKGGELEFVMSTEPNRAFGTGEGNFPVAAINAKSIMPGPFSDATQRSFSGTAEFTLKSVVPDAKIYYTLDGSDPDRSARLYTDTIRLNRSAHVKFFALHEDLGRSNTVEMDLVKFPEGRSITLATEYHRQYTAGGDSALIDGIRGEENFRLGAWQGYNGPDLSATIDLGKQQRLYKLTTGFLQDINSWIFMPEQVEYYYSNDGENFKLLGIVENEVPEDQWGVIVKDYSLRFRPVNARYVRVVGKSGVMCPDWHKGRGNELFIFADEILINQ